MGFKDNPMVFLARRTWEYSKGNRDRVLLYIGLFILANGISFFEPLVVGWILNTIQESGLTQDSMPKLIGIVALFIAIQVGFWTFHGPARVIERRNAFLARVNYKQYLLEGTMSLPSEWHTDHHSGDTIDKIEKGTNALYEYAQDTYEIIETIIRLIGSYIALAYFNLHSSYIVLFMVIATITLIVKFDKTLIKQYRELFKAENRISAKIFDVISNITTVIILRIEKLLSKSIMRRIMQPYELFLKNTKLNEIKWGLVSLNTAIMVFLVLASYIYVNVKAGNVVMVGTIYILYGYVQRINGTFYRFAYKYGQIVMQKTAVQNAEEISDEFKEQRRRKRSSLGTTWKELRMEALHFSYHPKDEAELHLDNVTINIKRNERIALVGESGSGKTTLMKVIRELYAPRSVKVYLDGKLLEGGFGEISEDIALIPQDPEIFSTTIRENITLGVSHRNSYIRKYTDMALFTQVIKRLPKGLESSIVEKGVNLSGGEKQRLSLARGLMACDDKQIVLLDEPTSSVDLKNEMRIFGNVFRAFRRKTIIASVHRLHLLPLFDRIYYFKGGRLKASGSLKQLLKQSKEFKRNWDRYTRNKSRDI